MPLENAKRQLIESVAGDTSFWSAEGKQRGQGYEVVSLRGDNQDPE